MIDQQFAEDELVIGDRVLVEADIYGRTISFRTVIVKINPDELWLGMSTPDHRLETLRDNHTLQLTIARTGGAMLGQSGFLRPLGGSKSRIFAVVRPGFLEVVQRRAHLRYQLDLPIHFRHVDAATREPRGKAAPGTTINVSPGGLLFVTETAPEMGEELDMTLPLAGQDRVSMIGLVTRVRGANEGLAMPEGEPAQTEVAVRFTRITAVDQDRIVRFILITEHRRREAALREPPAPVPAPAPMAAIAAVPAAAGTAPVQVPPRTPAAIPGTAPAAIPQARGSPDFARAARRRFAGRAASCGSTTDRSKPTAHRRGPQSVRGWPEADSPGLVRRPGPVQSYRAAINAPGQHGGLCRTRRSGAGECQAAGRCARFAGLVAGAAAPARPA